MIYLDNASTSYPKPKCVIDAIQNYLENIGVNAGRAAYQKAYEASRLVYETRERIALLLGVKDSSRIVFTQNATEAMNLAILGLNLQGGDRVIATSIEHNSVMRPLRFLEKEKKVKIDIIKCSTEGLLGPDEIERRISKKTKLIIMNHASNVMGAILPIKPVGMIAKKYNIPFLVDAAQTTGCLPISVDENNIDLLAFSGHKGLLGPQGVGSLYIREGIELVPLKFGGTGSNSESQFQPDFLPDRYESGTLNLAGIAGLNAGIQFILNKGIDKVRDHIQNLTQILVDRLAMIEQVTIYGPKDKRFQKGVVSINIKNKEPSDVGNVLDKKYNIATRVGLHCSPQTHTTIGTFPKGTVRISPGLFSTTEDISKLCEALCQIIG